MPDSSPRILLCGPSVRAFAQSATRAGYRVVAIDDFGDLDLAEVAEEVHPSPSDADGYEKLFREIRPDAWCYGGGWENKPALVERLSRIAPLWGNSAETLNELRDPFYWTVRLRERGLDVPEALPFEDLPARLADKRAGGRRWLSKRLDGANGSHVRWADEVSGAGEREERRYLQEFVEGEVESASFVAYEEGLTFLGACRQIVGAKELGAADFGFAGAVGPLMSGYENAPFFERLGAAIARMADARGFVGVDGVRTPDGRWLPIEINPRYAASMEALDEGREIPIFARHTEACSGISRRVGLGPPTSCTIPPRWAKEGTIPSPVSTGILHDVEDDASRQLTVKEGGPRSALQSPCGPSGCLAKGVLYARQELSLSFDLPAWRRFENEFPGVRLADLSRPGTISRPSDPILTLLVPGTDVGETQAALLAMAPRVYEELVRRFG